jgi:uncharacterized protein
LILSTNNPQELTINLRIPYWAQGRNVKFNGTALPAFGSPSGYLALTRLWKSGAKIDLSLPMALHLAPMPDNEKIQSMMYGPLVLAGRFDPVTIQMMPSGDYEPTSSRLQILLLIQRGPQHGWRRATRSR